MNLDTKPILEIGSYTRKREVKFADELRRSGTLQVQEGMVVIAPDMLGRSGFLLDSLKNALWYEFYLSPDLNEIPGTGVNIQYGEFFYEYEGVQPIFEARQVQKGEIEPAVALMTLAHAALAHDKHLTEAALNYLTEATNDRTLDNEVITLAAEVTRTGSMRLRSAFGGLLAQIRDENAQKLALEIGQSETTDGVRVDLIRRLVRTYGVRGLPQEHLNAWLGSERLALALALVAEASRNDMVMSLEHLEAVRPAYREVIRPWLVEPLANLNSDTQAR
jgi:hypothetical protein